MNQNKFNQNTTLINDVVICHLSFVQPGQYVNNSKTYLSRVSGNLVSSGYSITLPGLWGTTDDFATTSFQSLCPVKLSLLNQKILRYGQTILVFVS